MRKFLLWCLVAGLASVGEQGTFASFSASTTNEASVFESGTLVLSNQRNSATACVSANGGATDVNDADCDALMNVIQFDGGANNARITVANVGNLDASSLRLYWAGGSPCLTTDEPSVAFHGTGDLCDLLRVQVMEYPTLAEQTANTRNGPLDAGDDSVCWYGGGTPTHTCGYNNNRDLADFSVAYDGTDPNFIDMGPIAAGDTRWFRIYLQATAAQLLNSHMGRRIDFGITWALAQ